jgi:T5SS/PEP-CTERM-associated repeat protein
VVIVFTNGDYVRAAEIAWDNVSGGTFYAPTNWVGDNPPEPGDVAVFDLGSDGYTVSSGQDVDTAGLILRSDSVSLELASIWQMPQQNTLTLFVGEQSGDVATLTIRSGTLAAGRTRIGHSGDAVGNLVVDGAGARLALVNSALFAGGEDTSRGELRILNGGEVSISGDGGPGEPNFYLGPTSQSSGSVMINGAQSTLQVAGSLFVGERGQGAMEVTDSATAAIGVDFALGVTASSSGSAFITGMSTTLEVGRLLVLGTDGLGVMDVDGGTLSTGGQVQIGSGSGSDPSIFGAGLLELRNGATMTSTESVTPITATIAAFNAGSQGTVIVSGPGSRWVQSGSFSVGSVGTAELSIADQGYVECLDAQVARFASATAEVMVQGAGTEWAVANRLIVGGSFTAEGGTASVEVADGGRITSGQLLHLWSDGVVDVSTGGSVHVGSIASPTDTGRIVIGSGGTLSGIGTLIGDVIVDGGTVSPGASPGALRVDGNYSQLAGSLLAIEIGGLLPGSQYDQLIVTGDLVLGGAVEISFVDGFLPSAGDVFSIFNFDGSFTPPAVLRFVNAPQGFEFNANANDGMFSIAVTAVPEPASLAVFAVGLAAVLVRRSPRSETSVQ